MFSRAPLPWPKLALFSGTVTYGLCSRCLAASLNCETDPRRCELSVFEIRVRMSSETEAARLLKLQDSEQS